MITHEQFNKIPLKYFGMAYHYTRALSRWIKAGRPVRNEEEIRHIFEMFCKPCEARHPDRSFCLYCNCPVNLTRGAMRNKIAMATEECPIDKWSEKNEGSNSKG